MDTINDPSAPTEPDLPGPEAEFAPDRPDVTIVKLLGLHYANLKTPDGGDLYITKYGLPFLECLKPENWYETEWFEQRRERLNGTSTVYRVPSKKVNGKQIDMVVKWSRVGQDVPLQTQVLEQVLNAEFNSPFEEFSLVEELRLGEYGPQGIHFMTHRPLAIYVQPERLQLWQTGRSKFKINQKIHRHPGVELDILRQYIMIYEWIKGVDAAEAFEQLRIPEEKLHGLYHRVLGDMAAKGWVVADMKPAHIIVRKNNDGSLVKKRDEILYALVDFELLQRTPEHQEEIQLRKRSDYLKRQRDRFQDESDKPLPSYLKRVNIFGVDYIYGHVESTGGILWIVGNDPDLWDYFQPERWRKTNQVKLSESHQVYYTQTKDNINLVWKTARVGETPEVDAASEAGQCMIEYGYNSPFEEFSFALELSTKGVATTYPRAIYMTGHQSENVDYLANQSRYISHRDLLTPDGDAILRSDHDYIKIWGYWNGPDELLADNHDAHDYRGIDALRAASEGLLKPEDLRVLLGREREILRQAGFESLNLTSHHLLLSADPAGKLIKDDNGLLDLRICNFELMKRL